MHTLTTVISGLNEANTKSLYAFHGFCLIGMTGVVQLSISNPDNISKA